MSSAARKKLRAKERHLAALGAVAAVRETDPDGIATALAAFLSLKERRFRELGIDNPFTDPAVQRFLRNAAAGTEPALELYTLTLDGRIVAVLGGAADRRRFSAMFIAFDGDDGIARHSPGDVLVGRVIRAETERGREVFDLGVGEAFYKRLFCSDVDALVSNFVPATVRGRCLAGAFALLTAAKRRLKDSERAMRFVKALRKLSRGKSAAEA